MKELRMDIKFELIHRESYPPFDSIVLGRYNLSGERMIADPQFIHATNDAVRSAVERLLIEGDLCLESDLIGEVVNNLLSAVEIRSASSQQNELEDG